MPFLSPALSAAWLGWHMFVCVYVCICVCVCVQVCALKHILSLVHVRVYDRFHWKSSLLKTIKSTNSKSEVQIQISSKSQFEDRKPKPNLNLYCEISRNMSFTIGLYMSLFVFLINLSGPKRLCCWCGDIDIHTSLCSEIYTFRSIFLTRQGMEQAFEFAQALGVCLYAHTHVCTWHICISIHIHLYTLHTHTCAYIYRYTYMFVY